MKRRVVEQGGLTLMISLPRKWAKKYGLKKGDELELIEKGKDLLLSTEKSIEEAEETIINIPSDKFMGRLIHTPYRFGYNKVEIRYEDSKVLPKIRHYLSQVMGYEIVDQGPNHLKVEMVAKELESEFEKMLRRVLLMTSEMAKDIVTATKAKDIQKLEDIKEMGLMNDKLTNFCERILNKHGYSDPKQTNFMYCTVWAMEQVGDDLRSICYRLTENINVNKALLECLEDLSEHIDKFNKLFYKHSNDDLWAFRQADKKLVEKITNLNLKTKEEFRIASSMEAITNKIQHIAFSLM